MYETSEHPESGTTRAAAARVRRTRERGPRLARRIAARTYKNLAVSARTPARRRQAPLYQAITISRGADPQESDRKSAARRGRRRRRPVAAAALPARAGVQPDEEDDDGPDGPQQHARAAVAPGRLAAEADAIRGLAQLLRLVGAQVE